MAIIFCFQTLVIFVTDSIEPCQDKRKCFLNFDLKASCTVAQQNPYTYSSTLVLTEPNGICWMGINSFQFKNQKLIFLLYISSRSLTLTPLSSTALPIFLRHTQLVPLELHQFVVAYHFLLHLASISVSCQAGKCFHHSTAGVSLILFFLTIMLKTRSILKNFFLILSPPQI